MSALPHEKRSTHLLLSSRFRYPDRRMFFGRMQLFQDRIEVFGLHWRGMHRRTIPLSDVEQVEWWTGAPDRVNLEIRLHTGEALPVWVQGAGLWKFKIEEHAERIDRSRGGQDAPDQPHKAA